MLGVCDRVELALGVCERVEGLERRHGIQLLALGVEWEHLRLPLARGGDAIDAGLAAEDIADLEVHDESGDVVFTINEDGASRLYRIPQGTQLRETIDRAGHLRQHPFEPRARISGECAGDVAAFTQVWFGKRRESIRRTQLQVVSIRPRQLVLIEDAGAVRHAAEARGRS